VDSKITLGHPQKQSEGVLLAELARAQQNAFSANRIYHIVSKSMLVFGITFALVLALPLLQSSDATEPSETGRSETHNYFNAPPNDGAPLKLEAVIRNELEYVPHSHESDISGARINVAGPNVVISAVPPLNKEWHRSVFERVDDALWALPDVDLVLRLATPLTPCGVGGCDASFDLESQQFLRGTVENAFTFTGNQTIVDDSLDGEGPLGGLCAPQPNRPLVTSCRLIDQDGNRSLCLWLRKSTVPGLTKPPQVALDVKWNFMDSRDNECIDRLNETRYRER
jgi:hypothetical protein